MWIDALNAGTAALTGYAADERIGPRSAGEDEDGAPVADRQFLS